MTTDMEIRNLADAIAQMNVGPIGPHLPEYVAFLQQHRYSAETIKCNLRSASVFSQWLHERQTSLSQLSDETLETYRPLSELTRMLELPQESIEAPHIPARERG